MTDTPNAQPIDQLIADYVAGNLCLPAKIMVDAHMELVPQARRWVADLEDVHGVAFSDAEPVGLMNADKMLLDIINSDEDNAVEASLVAQPAVITGDDVPWRMKMPGVYSYRLDDVDGHEVALLRIKPGVAVPSHTHEGRELALVLQGAFEDGEGHYARGDISVADEHVDHQPIACDGDECICFIVTDAPLRFKNAFTRMVTSILPN